MIQVLLLDDEGELREEVADFLRARDLDVTEVGSIRQFHNFFPQKSYDIVIVDRMLPDGDGLDLVGDLRLQGARCGVVMFTARDAVKDRLEGLQRGADHYLTKPIRLEELGAVIDTLAWRVRGNIEWRLNMVDWTLQAPNGGVIKLTTQEMGLLAALARQPGKTATRSQIADCLGKDPAAYELRNLDALVLRLRKKVAEVSAEPMPLRTVHGAGYALTQGLLVRGGALKG
jgi:DNA-binding response OmpR family regulator